MGRKGNKRRGKDASAWNNRSQAWRAALRLAGPRLDADGRSALEAWLGKAAGNAAVMVLTPEQYRTVNEADREKPGAAIERPGPAPVQQQEKQLRTQKQLCTSPGRPVFSSGFTPPLASRAVPPTPPPMSLLDGGERGEAGLQKKPSEVFAIDEPTSRDHRSSQSLRKVLLLQRGSAGGGAGKVPTTGGVLWEAQTEAEMVAAVELCKVAFEAAEISMNSKDFWRYDPETKTRPMRLDSMPYLEAPRYNKMFTGIDGQPQRRYYVYSEAGGSKPTAAIVVDAPDDAVWAVAIMGSVRAGHGKKALGELGRIAFEGRKRHRVLALEALRGATPKGQKLVEFYERCGAQNCGNTYPAEYIKAGSEETVGNGAL